MKTYMPLNGLRWSRNSGSANCDMPQSAVFGRPGGGKDGGVEGCCQLRTVDLWVCGWSFVVGLWLVFAGNEPFGWGGVFIF